MTVMVLLRVTQPFEHLFLGQFIYFYFYFLLVAECIQFSIISEGSCNSSVVRVHRLNQVFPFPMSLLYLTSLPLNLTVQLAQFHLLCLCHKSVKHFQLHNN